MLLNIKKKLFKNLNSIKFVYFFHLFICQKMFTSLKYKLSGFLQITKNIIFQLKKLSYLFNIVYTMYNIYKIIKNYYKAGNIIKSLFLI